MVKSATISYIAKKLLNNHIRGSSKLIIWSYYKIYEDIKKTINI